MTTRHLATALTSLALAAMLTVGCSKKEEGAAATGGEGSTNTAATGATGAGGDAIDLAAAKTIFQERCAPCHGANGKGDGPGAAALNPKPRNYTDKQWQSSVTDDQIMKTIAYGGAAVGKSPIMPASPDLEGKPAVMKGLVKVIRDYGK